MQPIPERDQVTHTAALNLYQFQPNVEKNALEEQLTARLGQLRAMLSFMTGAGASGFRQLGQIQQGDYLWACSMLADECCGLDERIARVDMDALLLELKQQRKTQ